MPPFVWEIVVIVNLTVAGYALPPVRLHDVHRHFTEHSYCQEWLDSDHFKVQRQNITETFVMRYPADNVPEVTLTAGCQEFDKDGNPAPDPI